MSESMIERAANAIADAVHDAEEESIPGSWIPPSAWPSIARAAIKVLDEPTDSIVQAVLASARDHGLREPTFGEYEIRFTLGAVMDAILAEHEKQHHHGSENHREQDVGTHGGFLRMRKEITDQPTEKTKEELREIIIPFVATALASGSDDLRFTLHDVKWKGEPAGDWEIVVKRLPRYSS